MGRFVNFILCFVVVLAFFTEVEAQTNTTTKNRTWSWTAAESKKQVGKGESDTLAKAVAVEPTEKGEKQFDEDWRFRVGGYGEMLFQHFRYGPNSMLSEGSTEDKRSEISIPRFVIAMDFKFTPTWVLSSEIEFEYGGTGSALEFEYEEESGEYELEIEKGGEVALEQFHITKNFAKWMNLRFGHMIVPVGLTNAHHEPIYFFGTVRPEGESSIIPCTWHENGISLFGTVGKFDYTAMLVNGLDPNFFSQKNFIKGGRQTAFEKTQMTNPAIVGRLDFNGLENTRLGVSGYYGWKTTGNCSRKEKFDHLDVPVSIISADAQFNNGKFIARSNFLWGRIGESAELFAKNISMPKIGKFSVFPRTPSGENAMDWYVEFGYNVTSLFTDKVNIFPFARYEYYNPQQKTIGLRETRYKKEVMMFGFNYFVLPNLVVKGDFSRRIVYGGKYNSENTYSLGVGYMAWYAVRDRRNR